MADDPTKDDPVDEAAELVKRFGDEAEKRVNKILDERLKVDDPEPTPDPEKDPENDPEKDPENDPEPAPKSLAQRLGF